MNKIKEIIRDESGAMLIVESTFVFPIMFFVIFFLLFMGNMYFSKAYVDNLVNEAAIRAAALCSDPNLSTVINSGNVPSGTDALVNQPYRYIFSGSGGVSQAVGSASNLILSDSGGFNSFFKGMEPKLNSGDVKVKFKNNIVNYTLSVTATYKISSPWRFIFSQNSYIYEFTSHAEVPVGNAPEFIRNVDMLVDYMQQSDTIAKVSEKISSIMDKASIKNLGK